MAVKHKTVINSKKTKKQPKHKKAGKSLLKNNSVRIETNTERKRNNVLAINRCNKLLIQKEMFLKTLLDKTSPGGKYLNGKFVDDAAYQKHLNFQQLWFTKKNEMEIEIENLSHDIKNLAKAKSVVSDFRKSYLEAVDEFNAEMQRQGLIVPCEMNLNSTAAFRQNIDGTVFYIGDSKNEERCAILKWLENEGLN